MSDDFSHFMSTVKVGTKGQIVIPKEIREMFNIQSGDSLMIMADKKRGIAIQKQSFMTKIAEAILNKQNIPEGYKSGEDDAKCFADAIQKTNERGECKK